MKALLTVTETAALLRLDTSTVRYMLRDGRLPGIKPAGGAWRVPLSKLLARHAPEDAATLAELAGEVGMPHGRLRPEGDKP